MIKIYSSPTCPVCKEAKEFLKEKGIGFEEKDISKDSNTADEMVKKSGQTNVPVFEIDGKIISGFNREDFEKIIK